MLIGGRANENDDDDEDDEDRVGNDFDTDDKVDDGDGSIDSNLFLFDDEDTDGSLWRFV